MRVLHVISSLDRKSGGPPVALVGLAIAQSKLGARVAVASTFNVQSDASLVDELRAAGVAVMLIGPAVGRFQRHPAIRPTLEPLIADADVVHIHTLWEEIQHQAAMIARRLGKPYVFVPHGMLDPWSLSQSRWAKKAYLAWRLRRDLNGAMFLHALNRDEADLLKPLGLRSTCQIIPNGFDRNAIPSAGAARTEPVTPTLLFLSRLHPKKGLDVLADAFAIVARERADVKLVVAGPDDGAEVDFDALITAGGLGDRVARIGPVYGEQKSSALRNATLFVLPSRQEGFSVAILEALASGLPVVITQACHFPEVQTSGAGKVVPLNAALVAGAILELLNDPSARHAAGRNAIDLAAQYGWDQIAARSLELYKRPSLAILANSMTPYRIALHQRIVREIPELKLYSLFTHAKSNAPWELHPPEGIAPVSFAKCPTLSRGGAIIRWLKQHRPSVVIVNGYNELARLQIIEWCRLNRTPVLLWGDSNVRGDRPRGAKAIAKRAFVRWVVKQVDGVLPCGSLGQAYFERYGAAAKDMIWMPYEPDYELIRNLPAERIEQTRVRLGLQPERRRIVYSGRLIPIKRVDLLVRAFVEIAAERPAWDLVIVGNGPERTALEALVPADLSSRVQWVGFVDDQSEVSAIYRNCDLLVHPADVEPWALVINEAAAAGLAIVASDAVGAAAELVRDRVNGRIVPAGDQPALRAAMLDGTLDSNIDRYKAASAEVLAAWRGRADPVQAVRLIMQRWNHSRIAELS